MTRLRQRPAHSSSLMRVEALESRIVLTAQMVSDFNSEDLGLDPQELTAFQGELYFTRSRHDAWVAELWKSDGTKEGTQFVVDFGEGFINDVSVVDNQLSILVHRRSYAAQPNRTDIYSSDGTVAGTELMATHRNDPVNGIVVDRFPDDDDGSRDNRLQLAGLLPESSGAKAASIEDIATVGDLDYFVFKNTEQISELWVTDGTAAGTQIVDDAIPTAPGSVPINLIVDNKQLFYDAGTPEDQKTLVVASPGMSPQVVVGSDGLPTGRELWTVNADEFYYRVGESEILRFSDGVAFNLGEIGSGIDEPTFVGDQLFFSSEINSARELFVYDGESVSSVESPFRSGPTSLAQHVPVLFNGSPSKGLFMLSEEVELGFFGPAMTFVITDGETTEERLVEANASMIGGPTWEQSVQVDQDLYLFDDWGAGRWYRVQENQLVPASTRQIVEADASYRRNELFGQPNSEAPPIKSIFAPEQQEYTYEYESGNQIVNITVFRSPQEHYETRNGVFTTFAGRALRAASGETHFREFDLSSELGIDVLPGARQGDFELILGAEGLLYFVADDGVHGAELWQSDGTSEGTKLAADIFPGPRRSRIRLIDVVGDTIFFMADDGIHGDELWTFRAEPEPDPLQGDLDDNQRVDFQDFLILANNFGHVTDDASAGDIDQNGIVDFLDFLVLAENFGNELTT